MSKQGWLYNLGPGRSREQVHKEIRAILRSAEPDVAGLVECTGYHPLPQVSGYTLLSDTSRPGRTNIAAYVRNFGGKVEPERVRWHDMQQTWKRTEHNTDEDHPPRSWLEFYGDEGIHWLVAHQPPKVRSAATTIRTQSEGIDSYVAAMAPWTRPDWAARTQESKSKARARTRIMLWDPNRGPAEEGPGPKRLAHRIIGCTVGESHIEGAVVRRAAPSNPTLPTSAGGVRLLSDHDHAFRFTFRPVG